MKVPILQNALDFKSLFILTMNGVFIPFEFGKLKLNQTEEKLLGIYKYYTELGDFNHCALKNSTLAEMLYVKERTIQYAKKHLKELGYIKTNGGIRVWYIGIGDNDTKNEIAKQKTEVKTKSEKPQIIEKETVKEVENKPIVEETVIKNTDMGNTNFERVYEQLPNEYKNEDIKNYLITEKSDMVDKVNLFKSEDLIIENQISSFKKIINDKFHIYGDEEKTEEQMSKLKSEFFCKTYTAPKKDNSITTAEDNNFDYDNEETKELLDFLSCITVEPKVKYGVMKN